MSEVISLSTFHNHNLTDQDHALFMQTVTSQSGLFYGCEVTLKDENTLHVSTGEGIACGRIFRIMDMDYPVELSASGDLLGRLYVHIDTALDDTPAQLMDVQGSTLPALIQEDDMNQSTGVYEIELATFSINELGISNLEFTAPKATGGGAGGKSIAPDYSATESYEKGRIFFQNGTLYKTIAAIPAGAPLVLDTNVIETSLAAEIEALNQNLTLNYSDSSLPSSTTFNEFAQMVLERLYPKTVNFNTMTGGFITTPTTGVSYAFNPIRVTYATSPSYSTAILETNDYYDLTNYEGLTLGCIAKITGGAQDNVVDIVVDIVSRNGTTTHILQWNPNSAGVTTKTANLTSYEGEYKIKVSLGSGGRTVTATQFTLQ